MTFDSAVYKYNYWMAFENDLIGKVYNPKNEIVFEFSCIDQPLPKFMKNADDVSGLASELKRRSIIRETDIVSLAN